MNLIFIGILAFIFIIIINKFFTTFPSWDILDISNYLGGKLLKTLMGLLFISILLLGICISLAHVSVLLKTVYFIESPMLFIILFFIIGILICNILGFGAIKNSICFYFPLTLITLFVVLKSKIDLFSLLKITPILGNNIQDTFFNSISNIFIFTNIFLLFFIPSYLDNNKKLKKITIWSFFISWILYILSVIALLTAYPLDNIPSDLNSIYIMTKRIELTEFIQRSDGLFVFIWLQAFFSYISLMLYLITAILKKIFNLENEKVISYSIISLILGMSYFFITSNFYKFEGVGILKYLFILTIFVISFFVLIFSVIKKKKL